MSGELFTLNMGKTLIFLEVNPSKMDKYERLAKLDVEQGQFVDVDPSYAGVPQIIAGATSVPVNKLRCVYN